MSRAKDAKAAFPNEAALCECFLESLRKVGGWTAYPETAGFDILAVYDSTGHQLGIEAKLSLNAKVADQILPDHYMGFSEDGVAGPDFRAVIVPCITEANAGIAKMLGVLGVMVWKPSRQHDGCLFFDGLDPHRGWRPDRRMYDTADGHLCEWDRAWHDWNPPRRCELPEIVPLVPAGVPAPLRLTPWKIGALKVLAKLEVEGFVTAKAVRDCGVDARRFCAADGWLEPIGNGRWARGRMPAFDAQHPEAYAQVLAETHGSRSIA